MKRHNSKTKAARCKAPTPPFNSALAALAAGFRGTLAVFGEVAAAAPVLTRTALIHVAVLGLLLLTAAMPVVAVLVALLAGLDVLFVASALIGHVDFSVGWDSSSG
ncbi:membrane hypothetical protein [Mesorhizobium plurifarium]|uniref:Uncharacterized protein n=1 Tax=Mesorhizobium plurifarium TaxID=69974 RepID=A0A090ECJ7_MESPL|nr:membrane hypothetical protein [Mesorhizobium plurifarium]CDX27847.1 membrane hypothetical protein [Mesorhizobium plurifarium]CDX62335.1 membrane hypothetical protein [Mesorhizobium plurifarium]